MQVFCGSRYGRRFSKTSCQCHDFRKPQQFLRLPPARLRAGHRPSPEDNVGVRNEPYSDSEGTPWRERRVLDPLRVGLGRIAGDAMEDALLGSLGSLSWNTPKSPFSENRTRDPCNRSNHLNLCRPLTATISARQPGSDRRENAPRPDSKTQADELSQATHCFKPSRQLQQRKASTPKQPCALKISEIL